MASSGWTLSTVGGVKFPRTATPTKVAERIGDHFVNQGFSTPLFVTNQMGRKVEIGRKPTDPTVLRVLLPPHEHSKGWVADLVQQLRLLNMTVEVHRP